MTASSVPPSAYVMQHVLNKYSTGFAIVFIQAAETHSASSETGHATKNYN
jgi:hypothetical protein